MAVAYYNEIDPYAAAWLRNLIDAGHIAPGVVDTRSIEDVRPEDLFGFTQCHFFAGIGGWAHALDLAGWPRDRPVWTGSCPCQPFSAAGKGAGFDDERHLWPAWHHLIAQYRPAVVFGEQVASKAAEPWIDLVHADLEGVAYAFGCVPFPAAGIGAPHIRDRTYWVADTDRCVGGQGRAHLRGRADGGHAQPRSRLGSSGVPDGLADTDCARSLPRAFAGVHRGEEGAGSRHGESQRLGAAIRLGDADNARLEIRWSGPDEQSGEEGRQATKRPTGLSGVQGGASPTNGQWSAADWLLCRDGKWRPVEPGTFPLAHGVSGRVGRLRAYGNAIVPQQAAEFIEAYVEARSDAREVSAAA